MKLSLTLLFGALGLGACGSANSSAVRYDHHATGQQNEPRTRIDIEDLVADECDLPRGSTFFASDSSDLDRTDDYRLGQVAACMNRGALRHQNVVVIGYADARGAMLYNADLGMTRAEAVADALVTHGVAKHRLFIKSFGEMRASDKQTETDWARDRKVTLRVADPE